MTLADARHDPCVAMLGPEGASSVSIQPETFCDIERRGGTGPLVGYAVKLLLGLVCVLALGASRHAQAEDMSKLGESPACRALQAKYPQLKGKTLVDALNPYTPGYDTKSG